MHGPTLRMLVQNAVNVADHQGVLWMQVLLACVGVKPVLVHGGGPEINTWLNKVGIQANFKNGLRVTGVLLHWQPLLHSAQPPCVVSFSTSVNLARPFLPRHALSVMQLRRQIWRPQLSVCFYSCR